MCLCAPLRVQELGLARQRLFEALLAVDRGRRAHGALQFDDVALLVDNEVEVAVQVNGKVRDRIVVARDASKEAIEDAARSSAKVLETVGSGTIVKVVVVPGKLVNVVVK